jgi:hypothetical protein
MNTAPSLPSRESNRRRLWGAVTLATVLLGAFAAARADGGVLVGRVTDGKVPGASAGQAGVRAINPKTGDIVASADVRRNGTWLMRVPNGVYTVLAGIVRRHGAPQAAITPMVRVKGSKPKQVKVSLKRKRAPKVRRTTTKQLAEWPNTTPGAPIVAVKYLTGTPPNYLGKGMSDLLVTDIVQGNPRCSPRVVEWERRAEVIAEIELSNSRFGDPATRIPRGHMLQPELFVQGSLTEAADGSISWAVQLVDAATGKVVGGETTTLPPNGDFFEAEQQLADHLLDQICGGDYDINLNLHTDADFATHASSGNLNVTLTAVGSKVGKSPPRVFTATGTGGYEGVTWASKTDCTYTTEPAISGTIGFTLTITPAGLLHVVWTGSGELRTLGTVLCPGGPPPPPPIPGQPGPSLMLPTPQEFDLPVAGGQQTVGGGFTGGGDGWTHSGTIIITRHPPQ